ncbi:MAG: hypothetical protein ACK518_04745 [bacterium]
MKPNFEAQFESEEKSIQFTKAIEAAQSTHQAPVELGWFSYKSIVKNKADEAVKCASCDVAKPEAGSVPSGPIVDLPITSTLSAAGILSSDLPQQASTTLTVSLWPIRL